MSRSCVRSHRCAVVVIMAMMIRVMAYSPEVSCLFRVRSHSRKRRG
jgi:hypothetical protein